MRTLNDLKMSSKLTLGFSVVTLITIIIGGLAMLNIGQLSGLTSRVYVEGITPILQINRVFIEIKDFRLEMFKLLTQEDIDKATVSVDALNESSSFL